MESAGIEGIKGSEAVQVLVCLSTEKPPLLLVKKTIVKRLFRAIPLANHGSNFAHLRSCLGLLLLELLLLPRLSCLPLLLLTFFPPARTWTITFRAGRRAKSGIDANNTG
jgi:hypothetical protein